MHFFSEQTLIDV